MKNKILNKFNINVNRIFPRASIKFIKEEFGDKELTGAEIGVYKGENAESILKTLNIKKLYLIDLYDLYDDYQEGQDIYNPKLNNQTSLPEAELEAKKRLKKYEDKIIWIKKTSDDALNDIPNNLDFVYIDGNHGEGYIDRDINNYYKKLKEGGVLAGHDIENGSVCLEHTFVILAFIKFITKTKLKPYIQSPDWWVVKEKEGKVEDE